MTKRPAKMTLAEALAVLRDPDGTGQTRVSHGFSGQLMRCVKCCLPTPEQPSGVKWPDGPIRLCKCPTNSF